MLGKMIPEIQRTSELIHKITTAANEQNMGGQQISRATQPLDSVIQSNASASEEVAAQAESLQADMVDASRTGSTVIRRIGMPKQALPSVDGDDFERF